MPNPTKENVHVNRPLTNIAMNYIQEQSRFVADQVFPYVGVDKKSDSYFEFDKGDLTRIEAKPRSPGAESAGSGYRTSTDTFTTEVYAFHKDVSDIVRANSDNPLNPDRNATEYVIQNLLMKRELLFGNTFMEPTSSDYSAWGNTDNSSEWHDSTGTPIKDIRDAITTVQQVWDKPNVAVMGVDVYNMLRDHDNFVNRVKYTQAPGSFTIEQLMADVLDIDKVVVGNAIYNSAEEGASESMGYCIPNDALLLAYAPSTPQIDLPAAGYTFGWESLPGADGLNVSMKSFRMEENESDRIEGQMAFDLKQTSSALGYLFYDITLS